MRVACVVIRSLIELNDESRFTICVAGIWIVRRDLEARENVIASGAVGRRVSHVEESVRRIAGVKSQAKQTFLATKIARLAVITDANPVDQIEKNRASRRGEIGDHNDASVFLDDEQPIGF